MVKTYQTMEAGIANLREFGHEASKKATDEVLSPHSLGVPKVIHTPGGVMGTLEMGGIKTTCLITKPSGKSWKKVISSFSEAEVEFLQRLFQKDTMEVIAQRWGLEGAQAYYEGAMTHPTGGMDELCVRCVMCLLAGDILYWRTIGEMFLKSVDSGCAEGDMMVRAKKAQVNYANAQIGVEQVGERLGIRIVVDDGEAKHLGVGGAKTKQDKTG